MPDFALDIAALRQLASLGSTSNFLGDTDTQTIKNKTIKGEDNTLLSVYQNPLVKRTGSIQPNQGTSTNSFTADGMLRTLTGVGAASIADAYDTTEGKILVLTSTATANINAGFIAVTSGSGIGRRLFGFRMVTRGQVNQHTASRYYFGITSATTLPISDSPLATTDDGALIGFRSTDTNYQAITCDHVGPATFTDLGVAIDANFHTCEINWAASGNINFILDGVTTTVSATPPRTTVNLFPNCVAQTTATATAVIHTMKGIWVAVDK